MEAAHADLRKRALAVQGVNGEGLLAHGPATGVSPLRCCVGLIYGSYNQTGAAPFLFVATFSLNQTAPGRAPPRLIGVVLSWNTGVYDTSWFTPSYPPDGNGLCI